MVLGLTQPVTEMSTRNISWGVKGRCVVLTNLESSCADCLEIWEPQPPGTPRALSRPIMGLLFITLGNFLIDLVFALHFGVCLTSVVKNTRATNCI